jgi:hypothetical protein
MHPDHDLFDDYLGEQAPVLPPPPRRPHPATSFAADMALGFVLGLGLAVLVSAASAWWPW